MRKSEGRATRSGLGDQAGPLVLRGTLRARRRPNHLGRKWVWLENRAGPLEQRRTSGGAAVTSVNDLHLKRTQHLGRPAPRRSWANRRSGRHAKKMAARLILFYSDRFFRFRRPPPVLCCS